MLCNVHLCILNPPPIFTIILKMLNQLKVNLNCVYFKTQKTSKTTVIGMSLNFFIQLQLCIVCIWQILCESCCFKTYQKCISWIINVWTTACKQMRWTPTWHFHSSREYHLRYLLQLVLPFTNPSIFGYILCIHALIKYTYLI